LLKEKKNFMRRFYAVALTLLLSLPLFGTIPPGYYNSASGLSGAALKTALYNIITNHTSITYGELWTAFQTTDIRSNGKVWDMYSDVPGGVPPYYFTFISDQCGSYSGEGDCYNREHSWPSSWFSNAAPMYTDLFHLVPTDGYVNNRRSNYILAEVSSASWTSLNGSKLGSCATPGYSGTVFEPIDEYKGDFARNYFYMVTCYQNRVVGWSSMSTVSDILDGTTYPAFESWYLTMLGQWNSADPVSQKEIDRNNAVYAIQGNRNPFIDHPEYVCSVWGIGSTLPVPIINGPASVCVNSTGNVYTTESGASNYTWAVAAGGTITSGSGTNTIIVTWNTSGAKTVSVNYANACGLTAVSPTVFSVTVNPPPVPVISGPNSVVVNSTGNVYSTQAGMTNYGWTVSPGGVITAGGTATSSSITLTWLSIGVKTVSVNYTSAAGCISSAATVYNVTVADTLMPEPTNYPSDFSSHNIQLQWTDATGSVLPTGYLVRMSSIGFDAINAPADGFSVPNSFFDKNVPYSVQHVWFSNLNPDRTYYFKIFEYTGSGSAINYKTTGSILEIQQDTNP
jgi:endonuclease I